MREAPAQGRARLDWSPPHSLPVALALRVDFTAHVAAWSGAHPAVGSVLALPDLHRYVACASGPMELHACLHGRGRRRIEGAELRWAFTEALALGGVAEEIAALLRPCGDIDAEVQLDFHNGRDDYWWVREFPHRLEATSRGLTPTPAIVDDDARVVGRPVAVPLKERELGALRVSQPIGLPTLRGGHIVYLRRGGDVLTRPVLVHGEAAAPSACPLGRAMALEDRQSRDAALALFLDRAARDDGQAERAALAGLIAGLNGLPPATFDVLALLARRPALLARLALEAAEEAVPGVLALADGLPFAWEALPAAAWRGAFAQVGEQLLTALEPAVGDGAPAMAAARMVEARARVAHLLPALRSAFGFPPPHGGLLVEANAFLTRAHHRIHDYARSPFRGAWAERLPAWEFHPGFHRALDAPLAAALAAGGRVALNEAQVRCVKDVARRHPRWFAAGFAAAFEEYGLV